MFSAEPEPQSPTESLSNAAVSGVRWIAASRVPVEVGGLATAVVLAHLVTPTEFGRAAVVNAVSMLAMILSFESFGVPLVQRAELEPERVRTSFTLCIAFGLVMGALVWLFGAFAASAIFDPGTASLIRLVSPAFPIAAISAPSMAMLQRRLDFRALMMAEAVPVILQSIGSIVLAALGLGARAIVAGLLINYFFATVMLWRRSPPPRPGLDRRMAREIVSFGSPAAVAGFGMAARRNVPFAVLGAMATPTTTGLFWRAYQVGAEYQGKLSVVVLRTLFPLLSRTRDAEQMRRVRLRAMRANSTLTFPMLGLFVVIAPEAFPFVFGERWSSAVLPAQLLTVVGATAALMAGSESVAIAAGRPRNALVFSLSFLALFGAVTAGTAHLGLTAVCLGAVGVHLLMLVWAQWLLVTRTIGLPLSSVLTDSLPALVSTASLLAAGFALAEPLRLSGASGVAVVVLAGSGGLLAYVATLRHGFRQTWDELVDLLRRVFGTRLQGMLRARRNAAEAGAG